MSNLLRTEQLEDLKQPIGTLINGATAKTTPVDADSVGLSDSAASNILKKLTWANIKATLKTYFDTLYANITHTHAASAIVSGVLDNARVNFASPSAIGSTTANTGKFTSLNVDNVNATDKVLLYSTSGSPRWYFYSNSLTETGTTGGSEFVIQAHDNTGTFLGRCMYIQRSNLYPQFEFGVKAKGLRMTGDMGGETSTVTLNGTTAGSAGALSGYLKIYINTTAYWIPYYA